MFCDVYEILCIPVVIATKEHLHHQRMGGDSLVRHKDIVHRVPVIRKNV